MAAVMLAGAVTGSSAGCSGPVAGAGATGGVVGGAVGAGTGAIIGSAISNGDIAASAALGAAIGVPLGVALAVTYYVNSEQYKKREMYAQIRQNQQLLYDQQRAIDSLREEIRAESPDIQMPEESDDDEDPYFGPGLGNPYR